MLDGFFTGEMTPTFILAGCEILVTFLQFFFSWPGLWGKGEQRSTPTNPVGCKYLISSFPLDPYLAVGSLEGGGGKGEGVSASSGSET